MSSARSGSAHSRIHRSCPLGQFAVWRLNPSARAASERNRLQTGSRLRGLRHRKDFGRVLDAEIAGMGGGATNSGRGTEAREAATSGRDGHSRENYRTRETGRICLQHPRSGRTASTARNGAIELHVRPRNSLSYLRFAVRPVGERERNWKLAEGEGFEPPEPFPVQWFSRPPPSTTRPSLRVENQADCDDRRPVCHCIATMNAVGGAPTTS